MVFAGLFPTETGRLRGPARRDRQAPPERRLVHLRARELDGARLRLPLRLPRPPPHGDHPGAARARVQPSLITTAPSVPLPRQTTRGDGARDLEPGAAARARSSSSEIEEPYILATIITRDEYVGGILALCRGPARHAGVARVRSARTACPEVRLPAERGHPRLLRQAEVGLARLRLVRLRAHRLPPGRPREARRPHQRRAGRRPRDHRPPRQGAARRAARSSTR